MTRFALTRDGTVLYYYYTKHGVLVTSTVKPLPRSAWNMVFFHAPLSWSLWARNIRKDFRKRGAR